MHRTIVLNVVGLTPNMIGAFTPNLSRLTKQGACVPLKTVLPAVTSTVQSSMITGTLPQVHGAVANGWYFKDLSQIFFWRQSNHLVAGEKLWEQGKKRNANFTCAKIFWWFNMYSTADFTVSVRPLYCADGLKIPDIYTQPSDLRNELNDNLGQFPLFKFWGPAANIQSSEWIMKSATYIWDHYKPTVSLIYLPHLDYNLQRLGPDIEGIAGDLSLIDRLCGVLIDKAMEDGARVIVLSEYGVTKVSNPIFLNRVLRDAGFLKVREELGLEQLDPGASVAFAVVDHQIAHVYINDQNMVSEVKALLQSLPGVDSVFEGNEKKEIGLDHPRSGDLVVLADAKSWFAYYYWFDDEKAPDFARTVDIHRKPGYDPVELFIEPNLTSPKFSIAWRLLKKKMGFRTLMDVISLDATLVKGSHGRITDRSSDGPVFISSEADLIPDGELKVTAVKDIVLDHVFSS